MLGGQCIAYRNTAALSSGQTASASFTVCGMNTGAGLTMGYWQNKNGQALIVGADQAKLSGFLKSYAPFADAASPLASWVYNVIKAANASGSTMNAMLKGQSLATALSVYFSDPGLGGNTLNAPPPLSAVKIDLLHIPNSGNVSAAFGGATSGTVGFLLSYAAGQSSAGGSSWYGQNKTTQQLAKNTFDAINNQTAPLAP